MTTARAIPQFQTCTLPACPFALEYDRGTLPSIGGAVIAGGATEVGGILTGSYEKGVLRITGFQPFECEYAFGPKFILSERDAVSMAEKIAACTHDGQTVVGWYHSHFRRGLVLSAEDTRIYDRHFPGKRQVALVLRTDPDGGVGARFFFRSANAPEPVGQSAPFLASPPTLLLSRPEPVEIPERRARAVWVWGAALAGLAFASFVFFRSDPAPPSRNTASVPLPEPVSAVTPPPPSVLRPVHLAGRWRLQRGYSRSPLPPESVQVVISETRGSVRGTLNAVFGSRSKSHVRFSFSGKVNDREARFNWITTTGARREIRFNGVPKSPDLVQVLWRSPDGNRLFDEILRRVN